MEADVRLIIAADAGGVQAKLDSVVKSVNQADSQTRGSLQGWAGSTNSVATATEKLERQLKGFASEQRQQSRMAKFYANEILEMVPAADGAKRALQGLMGLGIEGLAGGLGFGLALESVKLLAMGMERVGASSKKAFEDADKTVGKVLDDWNKKADAMRRNLAVVLGGEGAGIRFDLAASLKTVDAEIKKAKESMDSLMFPWQRADSMKKLDELAEKRRKMIADAASTYTTEKAITGEKEHQAALTAGEKERLRVVDLILKAEQTIAQARAESEDRGAFPDLAYDEKKWQEMQPAQDMKRVMDSIGKGAKGDGFATDAVDPTNMLGSEDSLVRIQSFEEAMGKATDKGKGLASAGNAISEAFGSVGAAIGGVGGAITAQIGNIVQLTLKFIGLAIAAAEASAAQIPVVGWIAAAGAGVAVAASIIGLMGSVGARAEGGSVSAFRPYLVGERGPELVVPSSSGTVIPNHQLGGGVTNLYVSTMDAQSFEQFLTRRDTELFRVLNRGARAGRV